MSRAIQVGLTYMGEKIINTEVSVEPLVSENKEQYHQYHIEDNGNVGYQNVCRKCGKELQRDDIYKGVEIAGKIVPFEKEEIMDTSPVGIFITNITADLIPDYQVKKVYLMNVGGDAKTKKFCIINYSIFQDYLRRHTGMKFEGTMKLRSNSKPDNIVMRYDEQRNCISIAVLYYAEELMPAQRMEDAPLPAETLARVSDGSFKGIREISINSLIDMQNKAYYESIKDKLENPEKVAVSKEVKQKEELGAILAKML